MQNIPVLHMISEMQLVMELCFLINTKAPHASSPVQKNYYFTKGLWLFTCLSSGIKTLWDPPSLLKWLQGDIIHLFNDIRAVYLVCPISY